MLESTWYAVAGAAFVFTLAWLFVEKRITTTSITAMSLWFFAAVSDGDLTRITESGSTVAVDVAALQYPALAFGVLSLLAGVLHWFDQYPPEDGPAAGDAMPAARGD